MGTGQHILTRKTPSAMFLVMTIADDGEDAVREGISGLTDLVTTVSSRAPEATLSAIIAVGSDAWDRLFSGPRPALLHPFIELTGDVHTAPSTPGDLLLHIKSDRMDLAYEVGRLWTASIGDAVTVIDEVHGFRYFDMRDLIGFVDGTENPTGDDAVDAIVVGDEDPDFAGGTYVAVQRYVTDFDEWDALPVAEQEAAIGRTKLENVEFGDDVKPTNSHIALNVIEDEDGNELDIVRDNMPYGEFGGDGESGTLFIAYSNTPDVTEQMLRNMFIGEPEGNHDRLLDFTTAVTGSQYFAPTMEFLEDPPPAPAVDEEEPAEDPGPSDGSLGIGSLR
ncbi:Dyp-type peroxidase [Gordonia sp. HY002]|uniref:Dyp-type peroxidase n=1 Tax=Gordonia zhenghanii TaxID=2911516 RepID=UPI001EF040BC|nr:Dyp-type peroxidase [Gordonia zhenghanii]MCF8572212.1 Dyp-type peroxidase [Gordonia zhenghanii]MCF8606123.1 Dyp-type peroxidase [Gordonia zhenghanii]